MKRRTFLQGSAIGIASGLSGYLSWVPRANAATVRKTFYVTEGFITQPDGTDVYFQGYSSTSSALNVPAAGVYDVVVNTWTGSAVLSWGQRQHG